MKIPNPSLSSGEPQAVGGWWCGGFKLHSCDDEVETVAEGQKNCKNHQIYYQHLGWSDDPSRDLVIEKNIKFQAHRNLPVAVPPRDFWSSTYCPPRSAAMILWTRLVSWGSTNPAKGCLKPTNILKCLTQHWPRIETLLPMIFLVPEWPQFCDLLYQNQKGCSEVEGPQQMTNKLSKKSMAIQM